MATTLKINEELSSSSSSEWRDWSSLIPLLLQSILDRLHSLPDSSSFLSVCRSWRSLTPSPSYLSPILLLTRTSPSSLSLFDPSLNLLFSSPIIPFHSSSRKTIGFSHSHIITTTFSPPPFKPLLFNLLTRRCLRLPKTPIPFNRALFSASPTSSDSSAVLFDPNPSLFQLLRRPTDSRWILLDFHPLRFQDAIFFQGRFYALTSRGQLGLIPLSSDRPEFVPLDNGSNALYKGENDNWFLAECGGKLLRFCTRVSIGLGGIAVGGVGGFKLKVDVLEWDFGEGGGWVEVSSLGDRAVFFGSNGFAGSVVGGSGGCGVRENCVYRMGHRRNEWIVYSMEDQVGRVVDASRSNPCVAGGWLNDSPVWIFPSIR